MRNHCMEYNNAGDDQEEHDDDGVGAGSDGEYDDGDCDFSLYNDFFVQNGIYRVHTESLFLGSAYVIQKLSLRRTAPSIREFRQSQNEETYLYSWKF